MQKTTRFYGIKEIKWRFHKTEIENILRERLGKEEEVASDCDYTLLFNWVLDDDDEITEILVTKKFKQDQPTDSKGDE